MLYNIFYLSQYIFNIFLFSWPTHCSVYCYHLIIDRWGYFFCQVSMCTSANTAEHKSRYDLTQYIELPWVLSRCSCVCLWWLIKLLSPFIKREGLLSMMCIIVFTSMCTLFPHQKLCRNLHSYLLAMVDKKMIFLVTSSPLLFSCLLKNR